MAITFGIAPNPHWVVIDDFSKLPPGAAIYTFDSANKAFMKPAFQDAGGNVPFTNPIVGFGNGTFPPIYWKFDSSLNPPDLYYIEVWDKVKGPNNVNGAVLLWTFDGLTGSNSSGGGGTITTNLDLENLIVNGEFYWNAGNLPLSPATSVPTKVTLAPSNHDGFAGTGVAGTTADPSPDIIFAKSDTSATDTISFNNFTQGDTSFSPNPTPKLFVNYTSTGGSENYKVFQFPICKGLQNINNVNVSVALWNQLVSGNTNIILQLRQFFGNGTNGPSADVITQLGTLNFNGTSWTHTVFNQVLVPGIGFLGATLGNCGNDALFLQILVPSSVSVNFNFILPSVYLGNTTSQIDFHTQDYVDSVAMTPRTGDVRQSINSFSPYGWVPANDGFIGSASSGAGTRANIDTFPLYDLIWNAVPQSLAPVTGGRGASSIADFGGNKPMQLTRALGRVLAGALPSSTALSFTNTGNTLTVSSTAQFYNGMAVVITGGSLPSPLVSGVIYFVIILTGTTIQLATNTANALAGTSIVLTTNASGTIMPLNNETLGSFIGEEAHLQAEAEMFSHTHSYTIINAGGTFLQGGPGGSQQAANTGSRGGSTPFNIMQPTAFYNVFIKL